MLSCGLQEPSLTKTTFSRRQGHIGNELKRECICIQVNPDAMYFVVTPFITMAVVG